MIDTSMHDVSHATFTRTRGGYLSLEIPGLAEKRPSLVVGDKVVVRKAWDNTNWQKFYTILKSSKWLATILYLDNRFSISAYFNNY